MVKRILIILVPFLILNGCAWPSPTPTSPPWPVYATPVASLDEIPIFIGEMTFNELNNSGFTQQYVVDWNSDDLRVWSDGRVAGTFVTTYGGPPVSFPRFKDTLFFQVQARYIYPRYGDIVHEALSPVIPIFATQSSERSSTFTVDTTFQVPSLVADIDEGLPLRNLELTLTWVRVYKSDGELYVQVFAGDANRYPNKPQIGFDKEPQHLSSRFGYYSVLPESALKGGRVLEPDGEFEYYAWLKDNLRW